MKTIRLGLGTEVATELTLGSEEKVHEIHYMGEILRVTTIGNIIDVDIFSWFKDMRDRLKL